MSAKLMGQVYELQLGHSQQSIALALADHGHDDGSHIFPGHEYLEWKTGYSERQIIRLLQELESIGLLVPVDGQAVGRGNRQEYFMDTEAVPKKQPFKEWKQGQKGDKTASFRKGDILSKGDKRDTEKVTPCPIKGDKRDTRHIEYPRVEPSCEPKSIEPSVECVSTNNVPPRAQATAGASNGQSHTQPPPGSSQVQTSRQPAQPPPTTTGVLNADRRALLDAALDLVGMKARYEMGTVSNSWKRSLSDFLRLLEADGRTPADVATVRAKWPLYLNRPDAGPPSIAQALDNFDAVFNFVPREKTNGTHNRQHQPYQTAAERNNAAWERWGADLLSGAERINAEPCRTAN